MIIKREIITSKKPLKLSNGAVINRFCHVLAGADIGSQVMIGEHCYISRDVIIGFKTRIQNHNNLYDGIRIGSNVFIGPNCTLTNHRDPSDRFDRPFSPDQIVIDESATICAGVTIVCPRRIGAFSRIGAGALVLRDIKENEKVNWLIKEKKNNAKRKSKA